MVDNKPGAKARTKKASSSTSQEAVVLPLSFRIYTVETMPPHYAGYATIDALYVDSEWKCWLYRWHEVTRNKPKHRNFFAVMHNEDGYVIRLLHDHAWKAAPHSAKPNMNDFLPVQVLLGPLNTETGELESE